MAVVYKYTDVLETMYGNGDAKQAKRVRPVTFGGLQSRGYVKFKNMETWAKSDANSMLYLFPMRWSSSIDRLYMATSKTLNASEDLVFDLVVLGATGVPSDKSDDAHLGNLTTLKTLFSGINLQNVASYTFIVRDIRGKTLFELVNSSDAEKLAFEPFKDTPAGFLALKVTTPSTKTADDTDLHFTVEYSEGAPSGMPLDKISI